MKKGQMDEEARLATLEKKALQALQPTLPEKPKESTNWDDFVEKSDSEEGDLENSKALVAKPATRKQPKKKVERDMNHEEPSMPKPSIAKPVYGNKHQFDARRLEFEKSKPKKQVNPERLALVNNLFPSSEPTKGKEAPKPGNVAQFKGADVVSVDWDAFVEKEDTEEE